MEPIDGVCLREAIALTRARIDAGAPPSAVIAEVEAFWQARGMTVSKAGLLVQMGRYALGLSIADLKEAWAHWPGFPSAPPGTELDAFLAPRIAAARPHRQQHAGRSAPRTANDAIAWLAACGAHPWLVRHHELVLEAAEEITRALGVELMLAFEHDDVLLGAAIHDAGKMEHPAEMHAPGREHERAGERALLDAGFEPRIARACVTHAAWDEPRATLEDRLIALADKLWKGKRDEALERAMIDEIARVAEREPWEVFEKFDAICERVAAHGPERLARSQI